MRGRVNAELVQSMRCQLPGELLPGIDQLFVDLRLTQRYTRQLQPGVQLLVQRLRRMPGGILRGQHVVQHELRRLWDLQWCSLFVQPARQLVVQLVPELSSGLLRRQHVVQHELRRLWDLEWFSEVLQPDRRVELQLV